MRQNLNGMLLDAQRSHRAVGSFNVYSYETVRGVFEAAQANSAPVIIAFGERYLSSMSFDSIVAITDTIGRDYDVDYVIHLDHCKSRANTYRAMNAGFTSVMFDGSALEFSENIARTAQVVQVAHSVGVSVEAELGSLAASDDSQEGEADSEMAYTDPAQALEFVNQTGVDALAVSIGTVHGSYKGHPHIRVDILEHIRKLVATPLVLHGGSGTPPELIRQCISAGITKINVNTEISRAAVDRVREIVTSESVHLSTLGDQIVAQVNDTVADQIRLFDNRD